MTIEGWEEAEPKPRKGGSPGTCFVAMAFHPSLESVYDIGIKPAIEIDCDLKALRVDRVEHNGQITDQIIAGIRECAFTVADFTLHRNGVYYEAGFARGLGWTVISCCKKNAIKRVHFDTSVISHVIWEDPDELRIKLANRIKATIIEAI